MAPKGKGKGKAVTTPTRRSPRLSGTFPTSTSTPNPPTKDPTPTTKSGAMLVYVINAVGNNVHVQEFYVDHPLLSGFEGKQRPQAMFLTDAMVVEMKKCLGTCNPKTHVKIRETYRYTSEPEDGDVDEFRIEPYDDGREFVNALVYDFVMEFGREAKTGDVTSSTAYIIDHTTVST